MLHALQQYLRAAAASGRTVHRTAPFTLFVTPGDDRSYGNYALPDRDAAPTAGQIDGLRAAFAAVERAPRLEYLAALAPRVEPALLAAGFAVQLRMPLMACTPERWRAVPVPDGVAFEAVSAAPDGPAVELVRGQYEAFGEQLDDAELRAAAERLSPLSLLARVGGQPAGGAGCAPLLGGVTELGIGILARFRRRGIAAAATAELTRRAFAAGARTVVLTPADEATARIYARAGFAPVGEMLHLAG